MKQNKRKGKTWEEIFGKDWSVKMRKRLVKRNKEMKGKKNGMWSGDNPTYGALHQWVRNHLGSPMKCEKCNKIIKSRRKIHWCNKSGRYLRSLKDWIRLCVSCHKIFDNNFYGLYKKKK